MAQMNKRKSHTPIKTHEGAPSFHEGPLAALQRMLNAHMLWEDTFYIDGENAADHLKEAVINATKHDAIATQSMILSARREHNIRHASLMAAVEFAKVAEAPLGKDLIFGIIQRADELAEVLVMAGVQPGKPARLPAAVKKGVRQAFGKFDEYQLAKYKGVGRHVGLRNAVFLTHPSPKVNPLIQKIVDGTLQTPNTWETRLSSGEDKKETFEDLMKSGKLGAMALLRNLRNIDEANVDKKIVTNAFEQANWSKVLPFRFMTAAIEAPRFARLLDKAFTVAVSGSVYLPGRTAVLVDTSGSMGMTLSEKSKVKAYWAGACLAAAINGDEVELIQFGTSARKVPNFGSLSTAMSLNSGAVGHGTSVFAGMECAGDDFDRYIVISDMQFSDSASLPKGAIGYTINVVPHNRPGLLQGKWTHMTGWSPAVLRYMASIEG